MNENLSFINFGKVDWLCYGNLASILFKLPGKLCNLELIR